MKKAERGKEGRKRADNERMRLNKPQTHHTQKMNSEEREVNEREVKEQEEEHENEEDDGGDEDDDEDGLPLAQEDVEKFNKDQKKR